MATKISNTAMIDTVFEKAGEVYPLTKSIVREILKTYHNEVQEQLLKGNSVALPYGTFKVVEREERVRTSPVMPGSKETKKITIPKHSVVKFTMGTGLKEAVKNI